MGLPEAAPHPSQQKLWKPHIHVEVHFSEEGNLEDTPGITPSTAEARILEKSERRGICFQKDRDIDTTGKKKNQDRND